MHFLGRKNSLQIVTTPSLCSLGKTGSISRQSKVQQQATWVLTRHALLGRKNSLQIVTTPSLCSLGKTGSISRQSKVQQQATWLLFSHGCPFSVSRFLLQPEGNWLQWIWCVGEGACKLYEKRRICLDTCNGNWHTVHNDEFACRLQEGCHAPEVLGKKKD